MLKLYFDNSHYDKDFRSQLFPLLKPFFKGENYTDKERIETYGVSEQNFEFESNIKKANVVILTMSWNYYIKQEKMHLAKVIINEAFKVNKEVWSVSLGDISYKLPFYSHVKVFRSSGLKSKLPDTNLGMPVFISDPLKEHFKTNIFKTPEYSVKPTIGFCGYASSQWTQTLKSFFKTIIKSFLNYFKTNAYESDIIFIAPFIRYKILKRIEEYNEILTNFIFRRKYRAGVTNNILRKKTTLEYYDNMTQSQYVLCIRGAGNFSVRFYETLAMGRIPVFVNTDCLLPLSQVINWKKHVVWVEANEQRHIGEKIIDFHKSISEKEFHEICLSNRTLWLKKLGIGDFFLNQKVELLKQ